MPQIQGRIESVAFYNEENLFAIVRLDTGDGQVTLLGNLGRVDPGETLQAEGEWEVHPRYGRQFKVSSFSRLLPETASGIREYLASGAIRGIGEGMARRIVEHFGDKTLEVLDHHPQLLLEVPGIGPSTLSKITQDWKAKTADRDIMLFLAGHGIGPGYAARILDAFGRQAVQRLTENPYALAREEVGMGFAAADRVARKLGTAADAPLRVEAGFLHVLARNAAQGHFYMPETLLLEQAARLLDVPENDLARSRDALAKRGDIVMEPLPDSGDPAVYLPAFLATEKGLAMRLKAFLSVPFSPLKTDPEAMLSSVLQRLAIRLSGEQANILRQVFGHRLSVITGGPGTGKTTLIRSILLILEGMGLRSLLAAPTGRAAKRVSEVTGRDAVTIHRLLEYDFLNDAFMKNEHDPLDTDAVIIDEASMVDAFLMFHLVRALPMNAMFILVGDVSQLPPVGPGNALRDIIFSERAPVFYLKEIFRQAQKSLIVQNAHRVNRGEPLLLAPPEGEDLNTDFYFVEQDEPEKMVDTVLALCRERIPQRFGFSPETDIQVLTPMHKGPAGTANLNARLQTVLNPSTDALEKAGRVFKTGDKVMQIKNNYAKEVFNGDIGIVVSIDRQENELLVRYDAQTVSYDFMELDELTLAYAISVHKSQGSEYPAVVLLLSTSHWPMLQRNLLYTGLTRARELLVLVGGRRAVAVATENDRPAHRLTRLAHRLMETRDLNYG